jgi:predicted small metal-binding protein
LTRLIQSESIGTTRHSRKEPDVKELRCRDAGFDCDAVVHGGSEEEVLAQVRPHAEEVHGVEVTPDMERQLAGLVHDA